MNIKNLINIRSLLLDNKTVKQTIFKNAFWLGLTEVIQKGIGFLVVIWLARHFGPMIYGQWVFSLNFVALFVVLASFGFDTLTVREVARDKLKTSRYIDNIVVMKMILGLIALGLIALIIQFVGKEPEVIKLVYFLGIYTIINTFVVFFQSIFRANEKMQFETVCRGIESVSLLGLVVFFVLKGGSILTISYAYIGAALIGIVVSLAIIWWYFSRFFLGIDLKTCKEILKEAWPFALGLIFATVYFKVGTVFLSIIEGDREVGIFSASYNLILLILLFPEYLTTAIYPHFSKLFIKNKQILVNNFLKLFKTLLFSGLMVAFLIAILAPLTIGIIYGKQYQDSIIILQLLSLGIIFYYIAYSVGMTLSSVNLQIYRIKGQFFSACVNIIANIILIPLVGIYGVVVSFTISGVILASSYLYFFYKKFYKIYFKIS